MSKHQSRKRKDKDNSLKVLFIILVAVIAICAAIAFSVMALTGNEKKLSAPATPTPTITATPQPKATEEAQTEKPTPSASASPSHTAKEGTPSFTKITASSSRADYNSITYGAENVSDKNSSTAWTPEENSENPWICFSSKTEQTLSGFYIQNGYFKSEKLYNENMRAKDIEVDCNGEAFEFTLNDAGFGKLQNVKFPQPVKCSSLKITVLSYYEGSKYNELCISEIEPY